MRNDQALPTWKRLSRRALVVPTVGAAALSLTGSPAIGQEFPIQSEPMPQASAVVDGKPMAVSDAVGLCDHGARCTYRMDQGNPTEYLTAVTSVGNVIINCTNNPITLNRTVTLMSSSSDNIGGQITGSSTSTGTITGTKEVDTDSTKTDTQQNTHTDYAPQKDKGPTSDDQSQTTAQTSNHVGTKDTVSLAAQQAFMLGFQLSYNHEWQSSATETNMTTLIVNAGDILSLGVQNARVRTQGTLVIDNNGAVRPIAVDSPSMVTASSLIAQTFTDPTRCNQLRPTPNVPTSPPSPNPNPNPTPSRAPLPNPAPTSANGQDSKRAISGNGRPLSTATIFDTMPLTRSMPGLTTLDAVPSGAKLVKREVIHTWVPGSGAASK